MEKKYVRTFEQWLFEVEDKLQRINNQIQNKTEMEQKYKEKFAEKVESAKRNSKMTAIYKKRSAESKSDLNKEINANKSNMAQMKVQIKNAEAKVVTMKQTLIQNEIGTLDLEKKKAEVQKRKKK
jgi:hypothetical protein